MYAKKIKAWNAIVDGTAYPGIVSDYKPPNLKMKSASYRASTMLGEVHVDLGVETPTCELTFEGEITAIKEMMGICNAQSTIIRIKASAENDMCGYSTYEHKLVGRWEEVDMGSWKAGESTKTTYKATLTEFTELVDGKEIYFVNVPKGEMRSGGIDRTAQRRAAIGM